MDKKQFVDELAKLRPSATFLYLKSYRNVASEIADYSLVFHVSYKAAVQRSIEFLEKFTPTNPLQEQAKESLMFEFKNSLWSIPQDDTERHQSNYRRFKDQDGNYIKGIKLHTRSDTLHLNGLLVKKYVILPGLYDHKRESNLFKEKKKLRRLCPVGRFRQFKILPNQVDRISVENLCLLPPVN